MAIQFVTDQYKDDSVTANKILNDTITQAQIAMDGAFAFSGTVTSSVTPTADTQLANKLYVDSIAQGLHWKDSVVCATTANGTLATAYENGDAIDGITIATGDRILIKDQTAGDENGIWIVQASGSPVRALDMSEAGEFVGAAMFVREGTINADSGWVCTNDTPVTPGVTAVNFTQFTGAGQVVAGNGLAKSGNTLSVNVDGNSLEITNDALNVKALGVTNAMLAGSIAYGKLTLTASVVNADINASAAIVDTKLATIVTADKVSSTAMQLKTSGGLESTNSGLRIKAASVTNAMLEGSIAYGKLVLTNSIVDSDIVNSTISNGKLANSTMTVSDGATSTAISLGGTLTFTGTEFAEASGTISLATNAVKFANLKVLPGITTATGNASVAAYTLGNAVDSTWYDSVMVYRNGQLQSKVGSFSNPTDSSEYTVTASGSDTVVTFGAAPLADEKLVMAYRYEG